MNATEISNAIINGSFTATEINQLVSAIKEAQRFTRQKRAAVAINTLKVGARGRLTGLRPKSINGTLVEIKEIKRSRVVVQDVKNGSAFSFPYTVPAQCIELE